MRLPSIINAALLMITLMSAPLILAENQQNSDHEIFTPEMMKWTMGPEALPKGAQVTLLEGNPAEAGPFTLRLKFPANYRIPPHWHPVIEHITVLSGNFYVGMGDTLDEKQATKLPAGSFAFMKPEMHHFAFTHAPVTIQLHGVGPWGITYVNSQDDPRNSKKS